MIFLIPILAIIVFYSPILANPAIFLDRGNDMTQFFWPIVYYVKENIGKFHQIPLWNTLFFSGTPLFQDPQNPSYYLPNIIFLFTTVDRGFIVSLLIHSLIAAMGMYFAARSFKLSSYASIFASAIFVISPKLMGYVEAGHYGLIVAWAYFPYIILAINKFFETKKYKWSTVAAVSLAAIFYTHVLTFIIAAVAAAIYTLYLCCEKKSVKRTLFFGVITFVSSFILIAPVFIPQLIWQKDTTRYLLLETPDVYPKWHSVLEFIKALFEVNADTEKIILIGIINFFFAAWGFIKLNKKHEIAIAFFIAPLVLITLNNASPIYETLITQNWYILLRVSTRVWFVINILAVFLAAYGFEKLMNVNQKFFALLAFVSCFEFFFWDFAIIAKPVAPRESVPAELYQFLSHDKDLFRVFCLNRCISQKEAVIYNLELADGYGTLQQKNFYIASQQLAQAFYRNRYTLSIPPFEIYLFEKLQPYSPALASLRIKYVISDHLLTDKNLKLSEKFGKYFVYINTLYRNPNYLSYSPNLIRVRVPAGSTTITIPEIYSASWHAYLNGTKKTGITETKDATWEVTVDKETTYVDFKYQPFLNLIGK